MKKHYYFLCCVFLIKFLRAADDSPKPRDGEAPQSTQLRICTYTTFGAGRVFEKLNQLSPSKMKITDVQFVKNHYEFNNSDGVVASLSPEVIIYEYLTNHTGPLRMIKLPKMNTVLSNNLGILQPILKKVGKYHAQNSYSIRGYSPQKIDFAIDILNISESAEIRFTREFAKLLCAMFQFNDLIDYASKNFYYERIRALINDEGE